MKSRSLVAEVESFGDEFSGESASSVNWLVRRESLSKGSEESLSPKPDEGLSKLDGRRRRMSD
jgi:hypothetical protein